LLNFIVIFTISKIVANSSKLAFFRFSGCKDRGISKANQIILKVF